jgi:Flp pilus assembly protein TadG
MQRARIRQIIDCLSIGGPRRGALFVLDERGASAIEFALLAPVLAIALLGTVDVGRALTDQMAMGSLLRTAAQAAIVGGDKFMIERVLDAARDDASVSVSIGDPRCSCPENPTVLLGCYTTCAGSASTAIYYSLTAHKEFVGIFIPRMTLSKTLQVQVR